MKTEMKQDGVGNHLLQDCTEKEAKENFGDELKNQSPNTGLEVIETGDENIPIQITLSLADFKYLRNLLFSNHNETLLPVIDAAIDEHKQGESDQIEEFCRAVDEGIAKNRDYWEKLKNDRVIKNDTMEQFSVRKESK